MAQANREVVPQENKYSCTMATLLRDFMRMNPLVFFGLKVDKDPEGLLDKVYKILFVIRVSTT